MNDFRSPNEVQEVYNNEPPAERSKAYLLEYRRDNQLMLFFGSVHFNSPDHPQWAELQDQWKKFVTNANPQKLVLFEGHRPDKLDGLDEEQVLQQFREDGAVLYKAKSANILAISPEPDRAEEMHYLSGQFTEEEIINYYFARQMLQWHDLDHKEKSDWKAYAENYLHLLNNLNYWEEPLSLQQVLEWYKEQTGKDFDQDDRESLYKVSDPYQSKVSATSGEYRDDLLYRRIKKAWEEGDDLFVIYGSGHAIRLEPALDKLDANKIASDDRANNE